MSIKKRILWLDYTKLIGIYLVILGHLHLTNQELLICIYGFHMPLFFLLSGFSEKESETFVVSLRKTVRVILVPYFIFYIITYLWWFFISYLGHPEIYERSINVALIKPMLGMLIGESSPTSFSSSINAPLWFLMGLFFCKLFFKIVFMTKNHSLNIIILNVFALSSIILFHKADLNLFFSIDSAIMAIPFYTFGYYFKKSITNAFFQKANLLFFCGILLIALSCVISIFLNGRVDMNSINYGNNIFMFYINGIIGSIGLIFICMLFENRKNRFLLYLGANTLIIFAFHRPLTGVIIKMLSKIKIIPPVSENFSFDTYHAIIVSLGILLASVFFIYLIRNKFPWIIGSSKK